MDLDKIHAIRIFVISTHRLMLTFVEVLRRDDVVGVGADCDEVQEVVGLLHHADRVQEVEHGAVEAALLRFWNRSHAIFYFLFLNEL